MSSIRMAKVLEEVFNVFVYNVNDIYIKNSSIQLQNFHLFDKAVCMGTRLQARLATNVHAAPVHTSLSHSRSSRGLYLDLEQ